MSMLTEIQKLAKSRDRSLAASRADAAEVRRLVLEAKGAHKAKELAAAAGLSLGRVHNIHAGVDR